MEKRTKTVAVKMLKGILFSMLLKVYKDVNSVQISEQFSNITPGRFTKSYNKSFFYLIYVVNLTYLLIKKSVLVESEFTELVANKLSVMWKVA